MKNLSNSLLIISVFFLLFTGCSRSDNSQYKANHVMLIGLDGWGAYTLARADMPNLKQMIVEGVFTTKKRSVLPSSSAVNWASMFMGAGPELHGYTEWGSQVPELPSRECDKNDIFPTIFQLFRNADSKAEIGCIYEWEGIKYLVDTLSLSYYEQSPDYKIYPDRLTEIAEQYITEKKPNLLAICYDNPDHIGHVIGHDTPEYYKELEKLDSYIGRIINATQNAGIYENTIFIITSDHGGINKGHGGKTINEIETPLIITGKGIKPFFNIDHLSIMQYDIASTIAYIFNLNQPQVWIGRPILEIFK